MKPPTFIECTVCGREFGSKSIVIHERQCLQKLRRTEIVQDSQSANSIPGKNRRKKRIPPETTTVSIVSNDSSPPLLPRIQTDLSNPKGTTRNKVPVRPTTATLSKPKVLNPEYMNQDMSLMRIDYSTAKLRLRDDENHNVGIGIHRQNLVLPFVYSTGRKLSKTSPGKADAIERRAVKLPDSSTSRLHLTESRKQNGNDPPVTVVLPRSSEVHAPFQSFPDQSSLTFPILSSSSPNYSSDFLIKRMNSTEHTLPQITKNRNSTQSASMTDFHHLPNWSCAESRGECYCTRTTIGDYEETEGKIKIDGNRLELLHENFETSVPEVPFLKNVEYYNTPSEESFGISDTTSLENILTADIDTANTQLDASALVYVKNDDIELTKMDSKSLMPSLHNDKIGQWVPSEHLVQRLPKSTDTTVSFQTPISMTFSDSMPDASAWLFEYSPSMVPSPKSILKQHVMHQLSNSQTLPFCCLNSRQNNSFSGSDCDNETNSSGYGLLQAVSTRTILHRKQEQKQRLTHKFFDSFTSPEDRPLVISKSSRSAHSVDKFSTLHDTRSQTEKKQRFHYHKQCSIDKVKDWLEKCTRGSRLGPINDPVVALTGNKSNFQKINNIVGEVTQQYKDVRHVNNVSDNEVYDSYVDLCNEETNELQEDQVIRGKVISGQVSAIFKVQVKDDTIIYKFVDTMDIENSNSPEISQTETINKKIMARRISAVNSRTYGRYSHTPSPSCNDDKRVIEPMKNLAIPPMYKQNNNRLKTAPPSKQYVSLDSESLRPKSAQVKSKKNLTTNEKSLLPPEVQVFQDSCEFPYKLIKSEKESKPIKSLVFGANNILQDKLTSTQQFVSPGKRPKKERPLTPRPSFLSPNLLNFRSKQPKRQKLMENKSSQFPETRSTCVQNSPELLTRTRFCRPNWLDEIRNIKKISTHTHNHQEIFETQGVSDTQLLQTTRPTTYKNHQNIPELNGKKNVYQTHQVYQFHSKLENLPFNSEIKYGYEFFNAAEHEHEGIKSFEQRRSRTVSLESTYTLLIPKNPDIDKILDLTVIIRRRTAGTPIETSNDYSPSFLYLIIDEVEKNIPTLIRRKETNEHQIEFPKTPTLHVTLTKDVQHIVPHVYCPAELCKASRQCCSCQYGLQSISIPCATSSGVISYSIKTFVECETQTPRSYTYETETDFKYFNFQQWFQQRIYYIDRILDSRMI